MPVGFLALRECRCDSPISLVEEGGGLLRSPRFRLCGMAFCGSERGRINTSQERPHKEITFSTCGGAMLVQTSTVCCRDTYARRFSSPHDRGADADCVFPRLLVAV